MSSTKAGFTFVFGEFFAYAIVLWANICGLTRRRCCHCCRTDTVRGESHVDLRCRNGQGVRHKHIKDSYSKYWQDYFYIL